MHICYITHEYPIKNLSHGGVGTFTRSLGYKLAQRGVSVSVIRISKVGRTEIIDDNGVQVYMVPESKLPFKFFFNSAAVNKTIADIHRSNPISVVETPELGLAFLRKIPGIQYIVRMHGGHHFFAKAENRPTEWKKVWQEKKSFAKADHIIAVSNYVAETTRELLGLGSRSIRVLYNPIDTKKFYPADPGKIIPYRLFFAGTIIEKKGIRQLVQSLEYLVDDYPELQLLIAGKDANIPGTVQPYRPVLEAAISEKTRKHIVFLGSVPNFEIPLEIEKAQICCYPSHMEAMPLAWLEVLAMGKVFLGSKTGPGPEAVNENQTGYLTDPHDPKAIADSIRFIFEHYGQALELAKNARLRVLDEFDIDGLVQKNIDFYASLSGGFS